uniref:Endo/exonuclease/phosphatase domain-containing protein n=1 Tax=Heligmosomoides polygyrus TaxID=6339 RepID=A0A183G1U7_HELPZ
LNVGTVSGRSCELAEALDRRRVAYVRYRRRGGPVTSSLAPYAGCSEEAKDEVWTLLDEKTAEVPSEDAVVIAGDLNGHVGSAKDGHSCHGDFGYGARNVDGGRILEYTDPHNLIIANTASRKRDAHLVSFYSGSTKTQIDFILVKHRDREVTDAKEVPYDTAASHSTVHWYALLSSHLRS